MSPPGKKRRCSFVWEKTHIRAIPVAAHRDAVRHCRAVNLQIIDARLMTGQILAVEAGVYSRCSRSMRSAHPKAPTVLPLPPPQPCPAFHALLV